MGDRVFVCDSFGSGSYAEYMTASASKVFRLPETLSFSQGAALGIPYFTALRALRHKAHVKAGETLLVHGASGGVGLAACQIASAWGLDVVGTASTEEGMELVKKAGAKRVLNHNRPHYLDELKSGPDWKRFNVILEMLANVNLAADMDIVAREGRIVIIGSRGKIEIDPRGLMNTDASVTGMKLWDATPVQWKEMAKDLGEGFDGQWIQPVIDQEFRLEDAPKAHEAVMAHSGGAKGKIVLLV
ncbi:hypothetical protein RvY_04240-1 [Ramazzottius varieornatus]|uniref:Enoyl reductase (ER) domain-containing protein n=1 Tax=Ramazzottius varieornatus TaxID=947166 RepID=A0A1D1UXU4_RAMVA|nr:hypothetical protein RvY_04240-1 [Ramazzottius varieornatus]